MSPQELIAEARLNTTGRANPDLFTAETIGGLSEWLLSLLLDGFDYEQNQSDSRAVAARALAGLAWQAHQQTEDRP